MRIISFLMASVLLMTVIPFSAVALSGKKLTIGTLSDIHYYASTLKGNRKEEYQNLVNSSITTLDLGEGTVKTALYSMEKKLKGKTNPYLIIPGDITYQGEYESHVEIVSILEKWEKKTGIDVIVINGNHDINNLKASTFADDIKETTKYTSQAEFLDLYKNLGYDLAYHRYTPPKGKQQGGCSYSVKLDGGYRLILMDTNCYSSDATKDGTDDHETRAVMSDDLFKWVLNECKDAKKNGETIIGVNHSSLVDHLDSYQAKLLSAFILEDNETYAGKLADSGMHYIFCGHQHTADIASYVSDNGETVYECETPPTATFPNGMYVTEFTADNKGKITAKYDYDDIDCETPVVLYGVEQPRPFKNKSFGLAYGRTNLRTLGVNLIAYNLNPILKEIGECGGILEYAEKMGFNVEDLLSQYFSGISLGSIDIFTSKNIINLAKDLCNQITKVYLKDTDHLYDTIGDAIDKLAYFKVSDVPCTKFIDTLGFGDEENPGTLADLVLSTLYYMYSGNEDISDDKFMTDVLYRFENDTQLTKDFVNIIIDVVLNDLIQNEILSNLSLNIDELFKPGDIGFILGKLVDGLLNIILAGNKTFMSIVDFVFSLGILPYTSLNNVLDVLMEEYFTESQYESIGIEIAGILKGMNTDSNPKESGDHKATYVYNGKVTPEATSENYRKPSIVTVTLGEDSSSYNISWYTKKSVTGTDIEIVPYGKKPVFTGKPTVSSHIIADSQAVTRTYPGLDFGIVGILTVEKEMVRHTIKLTGLEAGKKYCYRIGDASRNWWSNIGVLETADNSRGVTFIHTSDCQSQNSKQYNTWKNVLDTAVKINPDTDFILSSGDLVDNGDNMKQWSWMADNASDVLLGKALMPTAGNHDIMMGSEYALDTNFILPNAPEQDKSSGVYYSFDYNNIHIAVLNTNDLGEDDAISDKQIEWLKNDMKSSDKEWKFVSIHKAVYSNGSHYDDDDVVAMRNQLSKLMPELDIDMVFEGHDHVYLRTDVMKDNKVVSSEKRELTFEGKTYNGKVDPEGTLYVISACSGVKYYLTKDASLTDKYFPRAESIVDCTLPVFSSVKIRGNTLYFDAYTVDDGKTERIDSFAIFKSDLEEYVEPEIKEEEIDIEDIKPVIRENGNVTDDGVITGDYTPVAVIAVIPVAAAVMLVLIKKKNQEI